MFWPIRLFGYSALLARSDHSSRRRFEVLPRKQSTLRTCTNWIQYPLDPRTCGQHCPVFHFLANLASKATPACPGSLQALLLAPVNLLRLCSKTEHGLCVLCSEIGAKTSYLLITGFLAHIVRKVETSADDRTANQDFSFFIFCQHQDELLTRKRDRCSSSDTAY
jgi:hypothetical protein